VLQRIGRHVLELGQAQVRNRDEVLARPEPASGPLGVLHQAVHRLHKRIAIQYVRTRTCSGILILATKLEVILSSSLTKVAT
jgi:hypothetical protein